MSLRRSSVPVLMLLALCAGGAQATQVGRAEFDLPSPDWVLVTSHEHKLLFDGGASSIPLHTAVFALPGPKNVPQALIVVTSTEAGHGTRVRWVSDPCAEPRPKYFANDYGSNRLPNRRECLIVNSAFSPSSYFAKDDWLKEAFDARGWVLFKGGQSIRSTVGNDGGTFLRVHLATQKGFVGMSGEPHQTDLHEAPQAQLQNYRVGLHQRKSEFFAPQAKCYSNQFLLYLFQSNQKVVFFLLGLQMVRQFQLLFPAEHIFRLSAHHKH